MTERHKACVIAKQHSITDYNHISCIYYYYNECTNVYNDIIM
jgi:hypothetical protein